MRRLLELFEEIQFGLSGHLANCPIDRGLVPEQPLTKIKKKMSPCGMSEGNGAEVFKVKDVGATVLEGVNDSGLEEKIKDAANACPVQVIMYDET